MRERENVCVSESVCVKERKIENNYLCMRERRRGEFGVLL